MAGSVFLVRDMQGKKKAEECFTAFIVKQLRKKSYPSCRALQCKQLNKCK